MSQYATLEDLGDAGLPNAALENIGRDIRTDALQKASSVADSYLSIRFTLPLIAPFPESLIRVVVHIASCDLLSRRGFVPASGADQIVIDRKADAIDWLKDVAKGLAQPDVVDSTPNVDEAGPLLASEAQQQWMLGTEPVDGRKVGI